jgi:hypothetical protein
VGIDPKAPRETAGAAASAIAEARTGVCRRPAVRSPSTVAFVRTGANESMSGKETRSRVKPTSLARAAEWAATRARQR